MSKGRFVICYGDERECPKCGGCAEECVCLHEALLRRLKKAEQELHEVKEELRELKAECMKHWTVQCKLCNKNTREHCQVCRACRQAFLDGITSSQTNRVEMEEIK